MFVTGACDVVSVIVVPWADVNVGHPIETGPFRPPPQSDLFPETIPENAA